MYYRQIFGGIFMFKTTKADDSLAHKELVAVVVKLKYIEDYCDMFVNLFKSINIR